jgi:hypothetical protein
MTANRLLIVDDEPVTVDDEPATGPLVGRVAANVPAGPAKDAANHA